MMKKVYCLSTCSTCKRIIKEVMAEKRGFEFQDIGVEKITTDQLLEMKRMAGSYDALFSRRAIKYREQGLKDKNLEEKDIRKLILNEYTFLKRPVIILGDRIFVGSEKKTIEELKQAIATENLST
ncbi:MAG: arsenate reductase family protein [Chitinophagales bacterium]